MTLTLCSHLGVGKHFFFSYVVKVNIGFANKEVKIRGHLHNKEKKQIFTNFIIGKIQRIYNYTFFLLCNIIHS